ncbi:hypothetical protein GALL_420090 [mine drainage metagenome]|uniref:Uncharacterized protein n=1 Tax=mine drainage metagenome TaxID=410659 RepID=A0A1J5PZB8_9ZZZZ
MQHLPAHRGVLQRGSVESRIAGRRHLQVQPRALGQRLGDLRQSFPLGRSERSAASGETHVLRRLFCAAAEERAQSAEGRGDDLGQHIDDGLPDDVAVAELRVVQIAAHRQVEVDHPVAVFQHGDRQVERQVDRVGAVHMRPEFQAGDGELVVSPHLRLADLVFQLGVEPARLDGATGELARIWRYRCHVEVAEPQGDVGIVGRPEGLQLPAHSRLAVVVDLAVELDLCAAVGRVGQAVDHPGELLHTHPEVGFDGLIGEVDIGIFDGGAIDAQRQRKRRGSGRRLRRNCRNGWLLRRLACEQNRLDVERAIRIDDDAAIGLHRLQVAHLDRQRCAVDTQPGRRQLAPAEERGAPVGFDQREVVHLRRAVISDSRRLGRRAQPNRAGGGGHTTGQQQPHLRLQQGAKRHQR